MCLLPFTGRRYACAGGYGYHGKYERIQDLRCQAYEKKFTVRRDTVLHRLKSHSEKVALALALLAEGMDVSALERVSGIREGTLRTWLIRAGMHAETIHSHFFQELIFHHIQLDELWANLHHQNQDVWLWVATEATSKLIPVIQIGPRTLDMAMGVVHALGCTMRSSCLPIFTTDEVAGSSPVSPTAGLLQGAYLLRRCDNKVCGSGSLEKFGNRRPHIYDYIPNPCSSCRWFYSSSVC